MQDILPFIEQNWMLCLSWALALVILLGYELKIRSQGVKRLSPNELTQALNHNEAVLIDIRQKERFKEGHIAQAIHMDKTALQDESLNKHGDKTIILVCHNGQQSLKQAALLRKQNQRSIAILKEGIQAWQQAKLPLVDK